jgi:hypothetical protein
MVNVGGKYIRKSSGKGIPKMLYKGNVELMKVL